jgi:uncharacterized phage-associated protein
MKITIFTVADWFLQKEPMTHKKLQKLCYYAQAWSYALKNRPMFSAVFEAWVHGPVSPMLYRKYRGSGFEDIRRPRNAPRVTLRAEASELLESVWLTYGKSTGNALEVLSHSEPPWIIARGRLEPHEPCTTPVSPKDMKRYYRSIYAGDLDAEA